jgi:hypothetical protein
LLPTRGSHRHSGAPWWRCTSGVAIPALKAHVGKNIKTGSRQIHAVVDAEGHVVLSTPTQRGGDFQHNHISICNTISMWLTKGSLPHLGGSSDRTCKGIFGAACPPVDTRSNRLN